MSIAFGSKTRTITRRVMCAHEPVSFWRENLIAVVILLRVVVKMSWWRKHVRRFIILLSEEGLTSFLSAVFFFSFFKLCCCNIVKPVFVTLFFLYSKLNIIRKKQRIIKIIPGIILNHSIYSIFLGVFKGKTLYSAAAGSLQGCSYISVGNAGGIMCCKDDSTTPTLAPTSAPTPGSCNFETGLCGWTVDSTAAATFRRGQGETPSRNTGPRYDHTKEDSTGIN